MKSLICLRRWYAGTLSDRDQSVAIMQQAEHELKAIDRTKLPGKHKIWCVQFALYPRLAWPLTMYEVALSRVEMIDRTCNTYIRKWLGLPRKINTSSVQAKKVCFSYPSHPSWAVRDSSPSQQQKSQTW